MLWHHVCAQKVISLTHGHLAITSTLEASRSHVPPPNSIIFYWPNGTNAVHLRSICRPGRK